MDIFLNIINGSQYTRSVSTNVHNSDSHKETNVKMIVKAISGLVHHHLLSDKGKS